MKRLFLILLVLALFVPMLSASAASHITIPTFRIDSVVRGDTVTITTKNFPANDTFNVYMGKMWTRGVGGTKVDTQPSGSGGTFTATYDIPASLKDDYRIAIRLESPTSGYYSYNWFYNNTTGVVTPSPTSTPGPAPEPFKTPTFSIQSVVKNDTVTIKTSNFPANDKFTVTMGYMWTAGINGFVVDTQESNDGGTFTATYDIPDTLKGQWRISIRLQSPTTGYYAYNWFYNNNAP